MGFDCIMWVSWRAGGGYLIILSDGTEIEYIPAGGYGAGSSDGGYWVRPYNAYDPTWMSNNSNPTINWADSGYNSTFQASGNGAFFVEDNSSGNSYYYGGS